MELDLLQDIVNARSSYRCKMHMQLHMLNKEEFLRKRKEGTNKRK